MQSSTFVGLRVAVLLAVLIGLPLAAMLGRPARQSDATSTSELDSLPVPSPGPQRPPPSPSDNSLAIAPQHSIDRRPFKPTAQKPTQNQPAQPRALPDPVKQDVRLVTIQRRLRQLGATYYLLEKWGADGQLYRFHCRVAIGKGTNINQHFEATDANAQLAMQQVLEQVEAWRAARSR